MKTFDTQPALSPDTCGNADRIAPDRGAGAPPIESFFRRETYNRRGDYHLTLDPQWSYYPTYLSKMKIIERILDRATPGDTILDIGCGEGALVAKYRARGYSIIGLDYNYGSAHVLPGDAGALPFGAATIDMVLILDVLEHLPFEAQERTLSEIQRVLQPGGQLVVSVPNLAHLLSRLKFLMTGRLGRTSKVSKHPGDRPIGEYLAMLTSCGFTVRRRVGITHSIPFLTTHLIWKHPTRYLWLHNLLNYIQLPNLSFVNIICCEKR